jgi:hypothetical protein
LDREDKSVSGWSIPLDKFLIEQQKTKIEVVAKKVGIKLFTGVIMDTPVKLGIARGSWQASVGTPFGLEVEHRDPSGSATVAAMTECALTRWKPLTGIPFILSSLCKYMQRLNEGWSKQAPALFIEGNITRVGGIAEDAARSGNV